MGASKYTKEGCLLRFQLEGQVLDALPIHIKRGGHGMNPVDVLKVFEQVLFDMTRGFSLKGFDVFLEPGMTGQQFFHGFSGVCRPFECLFDGMKLLPFLALGVDGGLTCQGLDASNARGDGTFT